MEKLAKRRVIPQFNITLTGDVTFKEIIKDESLHYYVINEVVSSIKDGISNNKTSSIVLNLSQDNFDVEIPRNLWKQALQIPLKFYENKEMYEKCFEIKSLIDNI